MKKHSYIEICSPGFRLIKFKTCNWQQISDNYKTKKRKIYRKSRNFTAHSKSNSVSMDHCMPQNNVCYFFQKLHKFAIFVTRSAADSKWALIGREIGLNSNWITELVKWRSVMFLNILFWLNDWTIKFAHLPRYIPYFLFNTQQTKSMCSPKQQQIFQIFEKFRIKFHFLFILCIFSINSNAQSKLDKITD